MFSSFFRSIKVSCFLCVDYSIARYILIICLLNNILDKGISITFVFILVWVASLSNTPIENLFLQHLISILSIFVYFAFIAHSVYIPDIYLCPLHHKSAWPLLYFCYLHRGTRKNLSMLANRFQYLLLVLCLWKIYMNARYFC